MAIVTASGSLLSAVADVTSTATRILTSSSSLTTSASLSGSVTRVITASSSLTTSASLSGSGIFIANELIVENIPLLDSYIIRLLLTLSDNISITDTFSLTELSKIIETIRITPIVSTSSIFINTKTDIITFSDVLKIIIDGLLSDNISLTDNVSGIILLLQLVTEKIKILSTISSAAIDITTISNLFTYTDSVQKFLAANVIENITITDIQSDLLVALVNTIENLYYADNNTSTLTLLSVIQDTLEYSTIASNNSNLLEIILNNVLLTSGHILDSTFTAWAYSPEIFAVSNFDNFNFTQSTKFKNRYLFSNSQGLYEYSGNLDDGAFIEYRLETAALKFGSASNLKQVPQIYIGTINKSDLILKVSVDGGITTYYQLSVDSNNLGTQYIKLGKGLIGHYWQFSLISKDNLSFNLDNLEFYPLVFGRKV